MTSDQVESPSRRGQPEDRELTMRALTKKAARQTTSSPVEERAEALGLPLLPEQVREPGQHGAPRLLLSISSCRRSMASKLLRQIRADPEAPHNAGRRAHLVLGTARHRQHLRPRRPTASSPSRSSSKTFSALVEEIGLLLDDPPNPTPGSTLGPSWAGVTRSATAARASPAQDGELRVLILEGPCPADAER